jgi:hypothetical protein
MPAGAVVRPRTMCWSAANIRRYDLENDAVVDRLSGRIAEGRKVDLLHLDTTWFEVNHTAIGIGGHLQSPFGLLCASFQRDGFL